MSKYELMRLLDKLQRVPHDFKDTINGLKVEISLNKDVNSETKPDTKNR